MTERPETASRWEEAIQAYEAQDRAQPPAPGPVLFTGSSSIALWPDLAGDFAPLPVLGRGFGGSTMADLRWFTERVILPYRPRAVVLYEGDNDIANAQTPAQVTAELRALIARARAALPDVPFYVISVKISPSRAFLSGQIRAANAALAAECVRTPAATFLDITAAMHDADGRLRPDYFVDDGLHMTAAGYAAWTEVIKPVLLRDLGTPAR